MNARLECFLENHRIRDVLVRAQIDKISPSLRGAILAEWEAATHMLLAAISADDVIGTADAAFQVDAVIHRANMMVLSPVLSKSAQAKRDRRAGADATNVKVHQKNASRNEQIRSLHQSGVNMKEIAYRVGLSVRSTQRIATSASD